jgi:methylated-DNA-protein-cysteine methyltransferase related protein
MPASPFFARIRDHVLQLTLSIPEGQICTFQSMGEHLDVMPRHVAYILSQLEDNEKMVYPWHRVVGGDGSLGTLKKNPDGATQTDLLRSEGFLVSGNRVASDWERVFISAGDLPSGLSKQSRPANAPVPRQRRAPSARRGDA